MKLRVFNNLIDFEYFLNLSTIHSKRHSKVAEQTVKCRRCKRIVLVNEQQDCELCANETFEIAQCGCVRIYEHRQLIDCLYALRSSNMLFVIEIAKNTDILEIDISLVSIIALRFESFIAGLKDNTFPAGMPFEIIPDYGVYVPTAFVFAAFSIDLCDEHFEQSYYSAGPKGIFSHELENIIGDD